MRIPSGVVDQYIYFVAVDATDLKTRETGLATWTVYRSRNGGAAAAMTTPTINETDSVNMAGVYELLMDEDMTIDAGDQSQEMIFHITHAGMAPVDRTIELYRPPVTAGETITVSGGAVSTVTTATNLTNLPAAAALEATLTTMKGATFAEATDSLEALRNRGDAAWITATGFATPTNITAATGIVLSGVTHTGAVIPTVSAVTGFTAADVGAIKTQTDKMVFTVANQIDSNVQYVNNVAVSGTGVAGSEWGP